MQCNLRNTDTGGAGKNVQILEVSGIDLDKFKWEPRKKLRSFRILEWPEFESYTVLIFVLMSMFHADVYLIFGCRL